MSTLGAVPIVSNFQPSVHKSRPPPTPLSLVTRNVSRAQCDLAPRRRRHRNVGEYFYPASGLALNSYSTCQPSEFWSRWLLIFPMTSLPFYNTLCPQIFRQGSFSIGNCFDSSPSDNDFAGVAEAGMGWDGQAHRRTRANKWHSLVP